MIVVVLPAKQNNEEGSVVPCLQFVCGFIDKQSCVSELH